MRLQLDRKCQAPGKTWGCSRHLTVHTLGAGPLCSLGKESSGAAMQDGQQCPELGAEAGAEPSFVGSRQIAGWAREAQDPGPAHRDEQGPCCGFFWKLQREKNLCAAEVL